MTSDRPSKPSAKSAARPSASRDKSPATVDDAYVATTRGVEIRVMPEYAADRSNPQRSQFFWLYTVEIRNEGRDALQLVSRHWRIIDGQGRMQEVRGEGVVGKQPIIEPGETFRYTSGCPLPTPTGFMAGTYRMVHLSGRSFDAVIPDFSLDSPHVKRSLN